jgi:hypothetical protein
MTIAEAHVAFVALVAAGCPWSGEAGAVRRESRRSPRAVRVCPTNGVSERRKTSRTTKAVVEERERT